MYRYRTRLARIPALASACALAGAAHAYTPDASLRADGGGGPYGGCTTCLGQTYDKRNDNALAGATVGDGVSSPAPDGSYMDASSKAGFGHLHAYSDAHRTYDATSPGDAQAGASASFIDYIDPAANVPIIGYANYQLTLNLNGSHTLTDGAGANFIIAGAQLSWDLRDERTGQVYASGVFDTTDAHPGTHLVIPVAANPNDWMSVDVGIATNTYVMSYNAAPYLTAVADYHDTLDVSLKAVTPGASTVGVSGFDYAPSAVPEAPPALSWLAGAGVFALRLRRRQVR